MISPRLGLFILLLGSNVSIAGPSIPQKQALARTLVATIGDTRAPGCALGVWDDGEWVFRSAYGLADVDKQRENTPSNLFGIASVTKQFTAAAIAIAAHDGLLAFDDHVRQYLREIPDYGVPITIRDLIHHTHGLRDIGRLIMLTGKPGQYLTRQSRIRLLAAQKATNFPAGTEFRYGNAGYMLLAEILDIVSGQSYEAYLQSAIFEPLHMNSTHFGLASLQSTCGYALPYVNINGRWHDTPEALGERGAWGYSGLVSNLDDYSKWVENLMANDSQLPGGRALLDQLQAPSSLADNSGVDYGFGFYLDSYAGIPALHHGGSGDGYKAYTMVFPARRMGVFGFCNNGVYAQSTVMALADIFLDIDAADSPDPGPPYTSTPAKDLGRYAGVFREPTLGLLFTVKECDTSLCITGDAVPYRFVPIGPLEFRNAENHRIAFEFGSDRKAHTLLQLSGRHYGSGRFERIELPIAQADDLMEFVGTYYSAEIDTTYEFMADDGVLTSKIVDAETGHSIDAVYTRSLDDEFVAGSERLVVRFRRNRDGDILGFDLNYQYGWITGLQFDRVL